MLSAWCKVGCFPRRPWQKYAAALGWQIPQPAFSGGSLCSR